MRVASPPPAAVDSPLNTADGTGQEYGGHVTRGAFALLSAQPLTWATSLASAVLVPRYLGDAGLGAYAVAWTIGVFVGTLVTFGLPSVLTRKVASQPALSATYAGGGVVIVTAFAIPISLALFVVIGAGGRGGIDLALVSLGVATAVVLSVQSVLMAVLVGLGRNARYAWSLAAAGVFTTVVGLATLAVGGDAHGFAVAIFSSWAISTLVLWRTSGLRFTRAALAPALLRELAVGGLPFLGWNIALRVRADIDVVLVGVLLQSNVAGWLAAAYRIINITVFIPTVITTPLLPALTRAKRQPEAYRSLLSDSLATVLLLTVPVSASVFMLAPVIPSLLGWPDSLQQAIPPMMILAFCQFFVLVFAPITFLAFVGDDVQFAAVMNAVL